MGRSLLGLSMAATLATLWGCRMCDDGQDYAPPVINSVPAGVEYYESVGEVGAPVQPSMNGTFRGVPTEATLGSDQGAGGR